MYLHQKLWSHCACLVVNHMRRQYVFLDLDHEQYIIEQTRGSVRRVSGRATVLERST